MRIHLLHIAVLIAVFVSILTLYGTSVSSGLSNATNAAVQISSTGAITEPTPADNSALPLLSETLIWCGVTFILLQSALIVLLVFSHLRHRRLKEALRASEKRYQDIASISSDWFWELDAEHKLTHLSDRYEKVTGQTVASQRGTSYLQFESLNWDSDRADAWKDHRDTLKARKPFRNFEYAASGADGELCYRRISGTPIFVDDVFRGYRGTGSDITEERARQAQLLRTIYEADHANRAKSAFLANMSHELRTPLNAIIGFSEILTGQLFGKMQNDRYLEYAKDINDTGQHLLTVLNDLLDISRIEAGFLTLDENVIDPRRMLRSCARMLNEKISAANLTLNLDIPPDLPALLGDETRLRQVVINLLTNAVKFTPESGTIWVSANIADDGGFEITVKDTGVGIAAQDLERVMEPFQQAEQDLSRRYGGVGLGLSLARNLTELHDGTINLESEPGIGALARVYLPADRVRTYPT
ncbi:ATP-binding protein [Nisaea sp.]|uniref:PAS domain-containing sensor histidine kinase n=1 Tax=Nisaea sp. TaxID=2024842 RepID=UPI0032972044